MRGYGKNVFVQNLQKIEDFFHTFGISFIKEGGRGAHHNIIIILVPTKNRIFFSGRFLRPHEFIRGGAGAPPIFSRSDTKIRME